MTLFFVAIIAFLLIALVAWKFLLHGPRLSENGKRKVLDHWKHAKSHQDAHRMLLEADAVVAELLQLIGFPGSMGDKLKKGSTYLPDVDAVWRAHKLRNRIAHEPGLSIDPREAARAMAAFEAVIHKFCR